MGMFHSVEELRMPAPDEALPGRRRDAVRRKHFVNGHRITCRRFPDGMHPMFAWASSGARRQVLARHRGWYSTAGRVTPPVERRIHLR